MKNSLRCLIVGFCLFVSTKPLFAQWVQTNGPYGGGIVAMMVSDSNLFASNRYGVFRTTNSGNDWIRVAPNQGTFRNITCFARIGMSLFAGSDDGFTGAGAFLSTDGGTNWSVVNCGLTNTYVEALDVSDTILFAGTLGGGVFRSTDNGTSWSASGLANTRVWTLAVSGSNVFAGTTDNGAFVSTDDGTNWTPANSGLPDTNCCVCSFCSSDTSVFCTVANYGVYRSSNNGKTWICVCSADPICHAGAIFLNNTNMFVGTCGAGIFRSTDYGVTWTLADSSLAHPYINCFCVNDSYIFAGDTHNGVYRTSDNGDKWDQVNQGMFLIINCIVVHGTNLYAGTTGGGVFLTTDDGMDWNPLSSFCASYQGFNGGISALVVTDTTIFISNNNYVDFSTDNGASWTELDSVHSNTPIYALTMLDTNLIAGAGGSGIFRSSNNGISWTQVDSGLTNDTVWALASNDSDVFAGTQNGIFLSTHAGASWAQINKGQSFSSAFALTVSGENLYACTDAGAYMSTDNGSSWTAEPGLSKSDIIGIAASNNILFAATPVGVWKYQLSPTAVEGHNSLPERFSLEQNYPNPFNPTTTINYQLSMNNVVTLKVYDVLGREVKMLVSEHQTAGNYSVTFNASSLPSGVYFYRLEAATFTETKKLMVLK